MATYYRINNRMGMGGFLCPPGHPHHTHSVDEKSGNHRTLGTMSLEYVISDVGFPAYIRDRAQEMIDRAHLVCSERWLRMLYGYFRNMYVPENGSTDVADLISDHSNTLPAQRHAAVAFIRRYFPDHEPRIDLIRDPGKGYAAFPCPECGKHVTYEPKYDQYCEVSVEMVNGSLATVYGTRCVNGRPHQGPVNRV